jgi:hypothetical protein
MAFVADRSMVEVKSTDLDMVTPATRGMHDIADAIWIPLHIRPFTPLPTNEAGPGTRPAVDASSNEATIMRTPGLNQPGAALYLGSAGDSSHVALGTETAAAINDLISDYNGHTHAITGVTPGSGVGVCAVTTSAATPIVAADIESPNVYAEKP